VDRREFLKAAVAGTAGVALSGCGTVLSSTNPATAPATAPAAEPKALEGKGMNYVCYCGLYCGLCEWHARVPQRAAALNDALVKGEFHGSPVFLRQVKAMSVDDPNKSCHSGNCGAKACAIRKCAIRRDVRVCPECADYPCKNIEMLAQSESTLVHDGQRMKKIGLEAWIAEQEERRRVGFCYSDVRCLPCHVPLEE
jgi:hypothetical protein